MSISQKNLDNYHVSIESDLDLPVLAQHWLTLEQNSNCSFFLSWHWIYTWLVVYKHKINVVKIYFEDDIVALALVSIVNEQRYGLLTSNKLLIHQTGNRDQDQIWMEYNGFLTHKDHHQLATTCGLNYLINNFPCWDEIVIGAITKEQSNIFKQATGFVQHINWQAPTFGVNLDELREQGNTYLKQLSRNTRYQITRSEKLYLNSGKIEITKAENTKEALYFFNEISTLHIDRWGDKQNQSGYANPEFTQFHKKLITQAYKGKQIDIWKLTHNGSVLGYFYNFIYKNNVYFYLSGLKQETDGKLKPGLLGHALCIQYYLDNGFDYYDFMGGNERYKSSLAKQQTYLYKASFQKPIIKFKIEQQCRMIKRALMGPR